MIDQKAENPKSMTETSTPIDLWDFISNDTEIDRHICKTVIYHMLFGANLIVCAIQHGLRVDEIVSIRMAFDQYTYKHKEQQCRTSN